MTAKNKVWVTEMDTKSIIEYVGRLAKGEGVPVERTRTIGMLGIR
jgi:hypothetical protein